MRRGLGTTVDTMKPNKGEESRPLHLGPFFIYFSLFIFGFKYNVENIELKILALQKSMQENYKFLWNANYSDEAQMFG